MASVSANATHGGQSESPPDELISFIIEVVSIEQPAHYFFGAARRQARCACVLTCAVSMITVIAYDYRA